LFYYFKDCNYMTVTNFIKRYAQSDINYISFLTGRLRSDTILKTDILRLGKLIVQFENGQYLPDDIMNEVICWLQKEYLCMKAKYLSVKMIIQ